MTYLILDVETTGVDSKLDRLVEVGWGIYRADGALVRTERHVIYQDGEKIPQRTIDIHGITDLVAETIGEPLEKIMNLLIDDIANTDLIVGHNIDFDIRFVKAGFRKVKFYESVISQIDDIPTLCTADIPKEWYGKYSENKNGTKILRRPTLTELHFRLFGKDFKGAHTAIGDVLACGKCLFRLLELEVIKSPLKLV